MPSSCANARYRITYYTETAAPDYILHLRFRFLEILRSPHDVVISSALISGSHSFMSAFRSCALTTHGADAATRVSEQCPVHTGELPVGVAGVHTVVFLHTYDRYYNKLTEPPCAAAADCILLHAAWCQVSRDLSSMTDAALVECPDPQNSRPELTWLDAGSNSSSITGVYSASFNLTRSGTYSVLPMAVVPSRRREFCHFDDTPCFIPIETPTKGAGGCHQMTELSPTARSSARATSCTSI